MKKVIICTVVYYDGVEAYTTHRALFVDTERRYAITPKSNKALRADMNSAGVELLKVDMNGLEYNNMMDFLLNVKPEHISREADQKDLDYLLNKFADYFVNH